MSASTKASVATYALTLWQPWATLALAGVKPYEFRRWPAPAPMVGRPIVIHAATRRPARDEMVWSGVRSGLGGADKTALGRAMELVERWAGDPDALPRAAGLGIVVLGKPVRAIDLFPFMGGIDPAVWGWPLTDVQVFPHPEPARGFQGFWRWPGGECEPDSETRRAKA